MLRSVFGSGALRKPVWTFAFDRRAQVTPELLEKAHTAVAERAVMVSTPAAVKAFMLKLLELLHLLDSGQYPRNHSGLAQPRPTLTLTPNPQPPTPTLTLTLTVALTLTQD